MQTQGMFVLTTNELDAERLPAPAVLTGYKLKVQGFLIHYFTCGKSSRMLGKPVKENLTGGVIMFVSESCPFVTEFVEELNRALRKIHPKARSSEVQKGWLRFCLLAIVVTNSVCWKRFERASLGRRRHAGLSWMFRKSDMLWKWLLRASIQVILWKYGITEGIVVLDDSDKKRSKSTRRIYRAHKPKER